jgi:hypothetical protein
MEEKYSLMAILRNDPDFAGALSKKKEAVKIDKQNLLKAAETYTQKYKDEILEGTKKRQKLLSEGQSKGLTEEEIFKGSTTFYPTVYTPILNFLYFMMRDEDTTCNKTIEEVLQEYLSQFGYEKSEMTEAYIKGIVNSLEIEKKLDEMGQDVEFEDVIEDDNIVEPEESDRFIYGNMDHATFKKLKKLKALSQSDNEEEAFLAYRKCLELCRRYSLEFDKIPCNVKRNSS